MSPQPLIDLSEIDFDQVAMNIDEVRTYNQQRYEMEQLDGIVAIDLEKGYAVAHRDVRDDAFWVRGHIPGRPILPGVLMIESAAQLSSLYYKVSTKDERFLGFGGVDNVKFRGAVVPGQRLIVVIRVVEMRSRKAIFDSQGIVDGKIVFEARITGMPL
ncbi:3-hydroxyacyl-ACP dehydratase FabZ family protein [Planctomycetota bacterium]